MTGTELRSVLDSFLRNNQVTPSGSAYYYILFRDITNNKKVAAMFVYPGSTKEMKMPLGSFVMYCAQGTEWHGPKYLFGPSTKLTKTELALDFYKNSNEIIGHTVKLDQMVDGNLQTTSAGLDEFGAE